MHVPYQHPELSYLRLLGVQDTRVAAASWLESHARPDALLLLSATLLTDDYVRPDLPQPLKLARKFSRETQARIIERLGPPGYVLSLIDVPIRDEDLAPDSALARRWANALVIVSDHPDPMLDSPGLRPPPGLTRFLAAHADPVWSLPIERTGDARIYEPSDMNFNPMRGAASLLRPGPQLTIWRVRPPREGLPVRPSPLLDDTPPSARRPGERSKSVAMAAAVRRR